MSTENSCWQAGQVTAAAGVALLVDPAVQVLKKGEVSGEHVLDEPGMDVGDTFRAA